MKMCCGHFKLLLAFVIDGIFSSYITSEYYLKALGKGYNKKCLNELFLNLLIFYFFQKC